MTAAIVLGAKVLRDGTPSPALRRRTLHAVSLYRAGTVSSIICCGGLGRFPPTEAEVMQVLCRGAGVPETAILLESASTSTLENLLNARPLLAACGGKDAVIVTDIFHKWRARMTARHLGIRATVSCPALDGVSRMKILKLFLREALALGWYWWRLNRVNS